MPGASETRPRWPAITMAALFLGYALGKAVRAVQGRLGFPGGPVPSASEHAWYAEHVMDVATAQWCAVATGLAAAALVLATVVPAGRLVPRPLMLGALGVTLVAFGFGVVMIVAGGFFGVGADWTRYHAVAGVAVMVLLTWTALVYARSAAPVRVRTARRVRGRRGGRRDGAPPERARGAAGTGGRARGRGADA
ncbi:hypothetical protein ABZ635_17555 [Nocardiopsis sp. NPDC007018]|uniref:hypothetical protein n=1 Tax=Nocardiopsis sp. NPDC007018 TaxID=3155721 RepID=UPI0033EDEB45